MAKIIIINGLALTAVSEDTLQASPLDPADRRQHFIFVDRKIESVYYAPSVLEVLHLEQDSQVGLANPKRSGNNFNQLWSFVNDHLHCQVQSKCRLGYLEGNSGVAVITPAENVLSTEIIDAPKDIVVPFINKTLHPITVFYKSPIGVKVPWREHILPNGNDPKSFKTSQGATLVLEAPVPIEPSKLVVSSSVTVAIRETHPKRRVTLINTTDVDIEVFYKEVFIDRGVRKYYHIKSNRQLDAYLHNGTVLHTKSATGADLIAPAFIVVADQEEISFLSAAKAIDIPIDWDQSYLPKYENINFSKQRAVSLNTEIIGEDRPYYCVVGSVPIPVLPSLKYVFEIEHSDSSFMALVQPEFTPICEDWAILGTPIRISREARRIRVIIDLTATPRTCSFYNLTTGREIVPFGMGCDLNNPSHYPIRLVISLPCHNSWAKLIPLRATAVPAQM